MLSTTVTTTLLGIEAHLVRVEVESSRGPASFDLVGLPEAGVRESRVRIRSALAQLGLCLDEQRVVVNLAPGDVRKTGSGFDLAIALALAAALGRIDPDALDGTVMLGELSLTGDLRAVPGVLPQLLFAQRHGFRRALVPPENGSEAAVVTGIEALVVASLGAAIEHFSGGCTLPAATVGMPSTEGYDDVGADLADVRGQHAARRALEIAAAGHHHLLLLGPPGGGKTMLARRLPSILPPLVGEEALEASAVHSIAGLLPPSRGLLVQRPFRAPHHTVSDAGLVGGGYPPRPGELSLAHHGVLFLDELAEFRRSTLETLRQPLEDGMLTIARARARASFPAKPLVVAASNPCPCGYRGEESQRCVCPVDVVRRYLARLSGPLVDRLDLHVALPPVAVSSLAGGAAGEASATVRARVSAARALQYARFTRGQTSVSTNALLPPRDVQAIATPTEDGQRLLTSAVQQLGLSARGYGKVLRIARTIADLASTNEVRAEHVAEAVQLRLLDRTRSPERSVSARR